MADRTIENAANNAVGEFFKQNRLMWREDHNDFQDIVDWIDSTDEWWLAGYVDAALGLPRLLVADDDDRQFYTNGRAAFASYAGVASASVVKACWLAGIDAADLASQPEKARMVLEGAHHA
jgi:hypothetical protein